MHWLEWVLWNTADIEAEQRALFDLTAKFTAVTLQVPACPGLETWALPSGMVAVLVGTQAPGIPESFPGPAMDPALLSLKVLQPDEYEHAVALGDAGTVDLVERFAERGDYHLNFGDRPSVLDEPDWKPPHRWPSPFERAGIPAPHELLRFDRSAKTINSAVIVVGDAAPQTMRAVHDKTAKPEARVDSGVSGPPSVGYFTLQLGAIRGFTTTFHMYGLPDDPSLARVAARMVPHARALIVAHEASALPAILPDERPAVPTALLGPQALHDAWTRVAGPPDFASALEPDAIFPALKAVARGRAREPARRLRTGLRSPPRRSSGPRRARPWRGDTGARHGSR